MKKIIVIVGVGLVVVLIAAMVAGFMFLGSIVKKGVETVGPQITKTEVKLGSASLSPLSGSGTINNFVLGNPEGYKTECAVKVGEVKVAVDVGSVFKDVIVVKEVKIANPEITFEGGLGGNNFSKILANVEATVGGGGKTADTSGSQSQKKIKIQDLTITGAKVKVSITGMGGKTLTLPMGDLHLTNIGTDKDGVASAEAIKVIMSEVTKSVTKVGTEAIANVGKLGQDAVKGATDEVNKATKGIKGLFGK